MKDNLEEFNYEATTDCDSCGKMAKGTMLHAHDSMGLATPVLFLCDRCYKPTWYQRIADECKRIPKRWLILAKYYLRTSRAQRAANRAKIVALRARREARRAA